MAAALLARCQSYRHAYSTFYQSNRNVYFNTLSATDMSNTVKRTFIFFEYVSQYRGYSCVETCVRMKPYKYAVGNL